MHKLKILFISSSIVFAVLLTIWMMQPSTETVIQHPITEVADEPVPDFSVYTDVTEKKKAFFSYLRPEVEAQNQFILKQREFIHAIRAKHISNEAISQDQHKELTFLMQEYRVKPNKNLELVFIELLSKVDAVPVELVLVQTANESAWGTSRFARNGYNFFGLWCFNKGCGFVPRRRNDGAAHEVAKFNNLSTAMYSYMRNLNRHAAYKDLRNIRKTQRSNMKQVTAMALTEGLHKYSERGDEYINELQQMIRVNRELMNDEV